MRNKIIITILLVILALMLFGCSEKEDNTEYIGIVSAMDNEIALLLSETTVERVDTIGEIEYHVGKLRGKDVVITRSGIGKIRASAVVATLLTKYNISKVIFTGIAGGIKDEPDVLDVIVGTRVVEHDYGILSNDGFEWTSGDPGMGATPGIYYDCDTELINLAYETAKVVIGADHVFKGTIATGDQFIASEDYVKKLDEDFDAYACEMEGAAAAVNCIRYNKPFVVIRALSDKADGHAHDSYANFGDIAAQQSDEIILKMLESL